MTIVYLLTGEIGEVLHEDRDDISGSTGALIEFADRLEYIKTKDYVEASHD